MPEGEMASDSSEIEIVIEDQRWREAPGDAEALAHSAYAASTALEPRAKGAVTLLLTDDATLKELNRRFRGKDEPTDVLSFPDGANSRLGDIAVAFETAMAEGAALGVSFSDHVAHLIVHGLLHLAGHDHEDDEEAERMETLEAQILATLGIADPYTD